MSAHENSTSLPRPDWVMCGGPNPGGGVRLIASKELNQAELEAQFSYPEIRGLFLDPSGVSQRFTLTAQMRAITVIDAPDYPAAFKSLFEVWDPGAGRAPSARRPLGEGPREIAP